MSIVWDSNYYTQCKLGVDSCVITTYIPSNKATVGKNLILTKGHLEPRKAEVLEVYEISKTKLDETSDDIDLFFGSRLELSDIQQEHNDVLSRVQQ